MYIALPAFLLLVAVVPGFVFLRAFRRCEHTVLEHGAFETNSAIAFSFDDVLYYTLPSESERKQLIEQIAGTFLAGRFAWKKVLSECEGLSQAEIGSACRDAIKEAILQDRSKITATDLIGTLTQRSQVYTGL